MYTIHLCKPPARHGSQEHQSETVVLDTFGIKDDAYAGPPSDRQRDSLLLPSIQHDHPWRPSHSHVQVSHVGPFTYAPSMFLH
jgi:hypothetical protein